MLRARQGEVDGLHALPGQLALRPGALTPRVMAGSMGGSGNGGGTIVAPAAASNRARTGDAAACPVAGSAGERPRLTAPAPIQALPCCLPCRNRRHARCPAFASACCPRPAARRLPGLARSHGAVPQRLARGAQPAQRLVVVLPGRADDLDALERSGVVADPQRAWPDADVVLAELRLGDYRAGDAMQRLHDTVVARRQRGYRQLWFVGASLGGMGSALYDRTYPGELDGIVLLAPPRRERRSTPPSVPPALPPGTPGPFGTDRCRLVAE